MATEIGREGRLALRRGGRPSTQVTKRRYAVSDGLNVVADVGGESDRTPVILMHGAGQTRHSWDRAMRELIACGYHVINLDTRGHGESEWSDKGDYGLPTLAEDLNLVIQTLDHKPALVGASMGAAAALYLVGSCRVPMAKALVSVDMVPQFEIDGAKKVTEFMRAHPHGFATLEEAGNAVSDYYPRRRGPKNPSGLMKNLRQWNDGRLHCHWDPEFVAPGEDAVHPKIGDLLRQASASVTVPTLLIRGATSDIVSDKGVADFRALVPLLEVVNIEGAGHMVVGDENDIFNKALLKFLDRTLL